MNDIRLIDANALKEKGIKWFIDERYYHPLDKPENMSESIFSSLIDNAPTVTNGTYEQGFRVGAYGRLDEIRPKGEWVNNECPFCGRYENYPENFCATCGADLRGEKE